jgi:hypothetical protein
MASQVDICNLSLSHFGHDGNIASIAPPDSIVAKHCARYYPMALAELLEEYDWSFARRRETLALLVNDREDFAYRYARPSTCVKERRLLPDGYSDDQAEISDWQREGSNIYTNEELAVLVFTFNLVDTTKFSPLFTITLSWRLSSYVAGPILKEPTGATSSKLRATSDAMAEAAKVADANMDRRRVEYQSTAQRSR